MPGIADAPIVPLQTGNSANEVGNFQVTPGVGDLMKSFKDGFITTEDITKRAADKPLENAQRQQALADTNIVRPKQRETAAKQLDIQNQSLGTQAQAQPLLDAAALTKAENILTEAHRGNDRNAVLNFYQQVTSPGQMPPKLDPKDPNSDYDYAKIETDNRSFLTKQRELQAAGNLNKFIKTFTSEKTTPEGGKQNVVSRVNEITGEKLGDTILSDSPKQKTPLGEAETQRIAQAQIAKNNIGDIKVAFDNLVKNRPALVGPVAGRLIGPLAGEYDSFYQQLESAITKTVPGLARGVFGEVGVLTDKDVERYTKLLPSAKKDPAIAQNLLKDLVSTVDRAETTLLDTYEKRGSDVSGFRKGAASSVAAAPVSPAANSDEPVLVNNPSEAPATAKFIKSPDGRTFKNPNYRP